MPILKIQTTSPHSGDYENRDNRVFSGRKQEIVLCLSCIIWILPCHIDYLPQFDSNMPFRPIFRYKAFLFGFKTPSIYYPSQLRLLHYVPLRRSDFKLLQVTTPRTILTDCWIDSIVARTLTLCENTSCSRTTHDDPGAQQKQ